jgi:hypothetical protein
MKFEFYRDLSRLKNRHTRSINVKLFPTWRCNFDCHYCSRHFIEENYEHRKEIQITPSEWIDKIVKFPIPVDIVTITGGGEPFLYKGISELIYGLIKRKFCVRLFSNLSIRRDLPSSKRLKITTTLHDPKFADKVWQNVEYYRSKKIDVELNKLDTSLPSELNLRKKGTKIKGLKIDRMGLITKGSKGWDQCLHGPVFCYSPDGKLFTEQYDLFEHYKKKGGKSG